MIHETQVVSMGLFNVLYNIQLRGIRKVPVLFTNKHQNHSASVTLPQNDLNSAAQSTSIASANLDVSIRRG